MDIYCRGCGVFITRDSHHSSLFADGLCMLGTNGCFTQFIAWCLKRGQAAPKYLGSAENLVAVDQWLEERNA